MDNKTAKQKLSELRDSLNQVLGSKGEAPSREDAEGALRTARDGANRAKKSLLGRIKDLPVIDKISQLGAAGTVAVSTAAVTQTNIAVDETEVFVASVANDVVEERLGFPAFVENFVNFDAVNVWGQQVMQAKVAEVKAEVARAEAKVAPTEPNQKAPRNPAVRKISPRTKLLAAPKKMSPMKKGQRNLKILNKVKKRLRGKRQRKVLKKKIIQVMNPKKKHKRKAQKIIHNRKHSKKHNRKQSLVV
jgi:hypothetical protein